MGVLAVTMQPSLAIVIVAPSIVTTHLKPFRPLSAPTSSAGYGR